MTRVERLAFAQEKEQSVSPPVLQLPSSAEQATLPLDLPPVEVSTSLEYIQAEAFLEVSGYFTPSSKRIKGIYTKEKKLREYLDRLGIFIFRLPGSPRDFRVREVPGERGG